MMKTPKLFLIIFVLAFYSCQEKSTINGLWLVEKVEMGSEEMTPKARWMRFNQDNSQESGNGWFQHSVGTWQLDPTNNELSIINTNGLDDPSGPFTIQINDANMLWQREEGGQELKISLKRIKKLPQSDIEELLGLWQLNDLQGTGDYFNLNNNENDYIFFKWDKRFEIKTEAGRVFGVYNVHGHKPEVELIPYSSEIERSYWKFNCEEQLLTMEQLNRDSLVKRTFNRIRFFPQ